MCVQRKETMANTSLHTAKAAKNDEFYTRLEDIIEEMNHYTDKFRGKIVYCNCDDPKWSNFWKYFHMNFEYLGLKKLITTHYEAGEVQTYKIEYTGGNDLDFEDGVITPLRQNGDFRSDECIELLKEADIVVTNPPFSLFREYVAQLMEYGKQFIILGNINAITYKEFFPRIRNNEIWLGVTNFNKGMYFYVPSNFQYRASYKFLKEIDGKAVNRVPGVCWFTNIDHKKRHEFIETTYKYAKKDTLYPDLYPTYDNYDAINVDKVSQIPMDYYPCWHRCEHAKTCRYAQTEGKEDKAYCEHACNGAMGVPVTYIDKHNPDQYEILGATESEGSGLSNGLFDESSKKKQPVLKKTANANLSLQTNLHSCTESVTVSWECQSHSLINLIQNSSKSSVSGTQDLPEMKLAQKDVMLSQAGKQSNGTVQRQEVKRYTSELLSSSKCNGVMGVPITFLDKYNPSQFEIVAFRKGEDGKDLIFTREREFNRTFVSLYNIDSMETCRRFNTKQNV